MHKSYKSSNFLKTIDKYTRRQQSKIMDEIKRHEDEELKKAMQPAIIIESNLPMEEMQKFISENLENIFTEENETP